MKHVLLLVCGLTLLAISFAFASIGVLVIECRRPLLSFLRALDESGTPFLRALNTSGTKTLVSIQGASESVRETALTVKTTSSVTADDARAQSKRIGQALQRVVEVMDAAAGSLTGPEGAFEQLRLATRNIASASAELPLLVNQVREDSRRLSETGVQSLQPLATSLQNLASLISTLETEVKTLSPQAFTTLAEAEKAISGIETIIADSSIQKSLKETSRAATHAANTIETVDIVTRRWREKTSRWKQVLTVLRDGLRIAALAFL